jgi:hypothetical protein
MIAEKAVVSAFWIFCQDELACLGEELMRS